MKTASVSELSWATRAIFDQLGLISDPHLDFQKPRNGLNDYKELENIYIVLQWSPGEAYGRHMTLTPAAVKINRF